MNRTNKKIVCLGGGIGTVNLVKGLKNYTNNITVAISMADEGGSAGRLRRLYNIFPPGDIVSCMAAIGSKTDPLVSQILTYRFPGDRYAKDENLSGHKLGSLIMVALRDLTGDFEKAIELFQKTFQIPGTFLPATNVVARISIRTKSKEEIFGEERIDLGKYDWKSGIEKVSLHPKNVRANTRLIKQLKKADVIIAGPGDLYTTLLPVLIVPGVKEVLKESLVVKIFVVNVTNKLYETRNYNVFDYITAVKNHLGFFPFTKVILNNNFDTEIPKEHSSQYKYITFRKGSRIKDDISGKTTFVEKDLLDTGFPLYHDPSKLAKVIIEQI